MEIYTDCGRFLAPSFPGYRAVVTRANGTQAWPLLWIKGLGYRLRKPLLPAVSCAAMLRGCLPAGRLLLRPPIAHAHGSHAQV